MSQITQEQFARIKRILGVTAIDNSADALSFNRENVTFKCVSGNIWINPNATAVANTTAFLLTAGNSINLRVDSTLSIISDVSGGTYEYIVWKEMFE